MAPPAEVLRLPVSEKNTVLIGESKKIKRVLSLTQKAAAVDSTILITGESGSGKELIAQMIHENNHRSNEAFVVVNCAAIPESLLESQLFGHKKGAFTNAHKDHQGFFEQADNGTIFLDEISEMPLSVQVKLLRVLENQQFYPVGAEKPINVDVRIIAATNKNLKHEMKKGRFRKDLFYRIHIVPIHIPPLRERKKDILLLAEYFFKKISRKMRIAKPDIMPAALQKLVFHGWPGNVRELQNVIEHTLVINENGIIDEESIPLSKCGALNASSQLFSFKEAVTAAKKEAIQKALQASSNIEEAAKILQVQRTYLCRLTKELFNRSPVELKKIIDKK